MTAAPRIVVTPADGGRVRVAIYGAAGLITEVEVTATRAARIAHNLLGLALPRLER